MKERNALCLMLLASFIWGITFAFQSQAADVIGPFMYNAIRLILGFIVLLPLTLRAINKHKGDRQYLKTLLKGGALCGFVLGAASVTQQAGIAYTTAGKAGFITSLYTLLVPVFSIVLGKKVSKKLWFCVALGLVGAFMLSINSETGIGKGDLLIFCCAVLFALQIMVIDKYNKVLEGVDLSAFQFLFSGLFCLIPGLCFEPFELSMVKAAAVPILYAGIFSCGVAYTFQIIGQKYVQPTKATLALSLENAWAAVGGAVILGEHMSPKELCGCILLFASVIFAQIDKK